MSRVLALVVVLAVAWPATAVAHAKPRNGRIVYGSAESLYSVRPDGSGRRTLVKAWSDQGVSPSPDGRSLATARPEELVFRSAATGDVTDTLRMARQSWLGAAAWSPDGREIAFQNCEKTQFTDIEDCVQYGIYRVRVDGTHLRRVAEGTQPSWSADGRSLTFVHRVRPHDANGNECNGIYVASRSGGSLRRVVPRHATCSQGDLFRASPFFAPGDRRVMYVQGAYVQSVGLDGRHTRHVVRARDGWVVSLARLSPDGRRIAFAAGDFNSYAGAVSVVSSRGGRAHRIVNLPLAANTLGWLPVASR